MDDEQASSVTAPSLPQVAYDGPLPEGGYHVRHSRTNHALVLGRAFINENPGMDPAPTVARIKEQTKIYPYARAARAAASGPTWQASASSVSLPVRRIPVSWRAAGWPWTRFRPTTSATTRCSTRWCRWSRPRRSTPSWPASSRRSGSSRTRSSHPTLGLRAILDDAVAVGNAAARTLGMGAHPTDGFRYYDGDTAWWNMLFVGGFEFINPPPMITEHGVEPSPNRGDRKLHSRTAMFYFATGITPAMCMRLTGVGSQYVAANVDAAGDRLDGSKSYRLTLPRTSRLPGFGR